MTKMRTVTELAEYLGGIVQGDGSIQIYGLGTLETAGQTVSETVQMPVKAAEENQ